MKNLKLVTGFIILFFVFSACEKMLIDEPMVQPELKSGNQGSEKMTGFDEWGFNWNAHHYIGTLYNAIMGDYLYADMIWHHSTPYTGENEDLFPPDDSEWSDFEKWLWNYAWENRYVNLSMHWNEALVSGEGVYPETWIDSDSWITFLMSGGEGNLAWSRFIKLVAAKSTDIFEDGVWKDKDGAVIGFQSDWTELILIQIVDKGNIPPIIAPFGAGLGRYKLK